MYFNLIKPDLIEQDPFASLNGLSSGTSSMVPIIAVQSTAPSNSTTSTEIITTPSNSEIELNMISSEESNLPSESLENNTSSTINQSLLEKWNKLSDLKKSVILLSVLAVSYYGYKQLKN